MRDYKRSQQNDATYILIYIYIQLCYVALCKPLFVHLQFLELETKRSSLIQFDIAE